MISGPVDPTVLPIGAGYLRNFGRMNAAKKSRSSGMR
jgi:hypothetical protein